MGTRLWRENTNIEEPPFVHRFVETVAKSIVISLRHPLLLLVVSIDSEGMQRQHHHHPKEKIRVCFPRHYGNHEKLLMLSVLHVNKLQDKRNFYHRHAKLSRMILDEM